MHLSACAVLRRAPRRHPPSLLWPGAPQHRGIPPKAEVAAETHDPRADQRGSRSAAPAPPGCARGGRQGAPAGRDARRVSGSAGSSPRPGPADAGGSASGHPGSSFSPGDPGQVASSLCASVSSWGQQSVKWALAQGRQQDWGVRCCGLGCSCSGSPGFLGAPRVLHFRGEQSAEPRKDLHPLVHGDPPEQRGGGRIVMRAHGQHQGEGCAS